MIPILQGLLPTAKSVFLLAEQNVLQSIIAGIAILALGSADVASRNRLLQGIDCFEELTDLRGISYEDK